MSAPTKAESQQAVIETMDAACRIHGLTPYSELARPLSQGTRPPEGWKLVPVEPTDAMCGAMFGGDLTARGLQSYRAIWADALAAAPAAPEAPTKLCKGCNASPCRCDPNDPCAAARRGGYEER